jgi:hypothetical protein
MLRTYLQTHLATFRTERDDKHDKRCCHIGRSLYSDGVTHREWLWQCVRENKNKSFDCYFEIAVLSQPARCRIGTSLRWLPPRRPLSCTHARWSESKANFLSCSQFAKSTGANWAIAFSEERLHAANPRGRQIEQGSGELEKLRSLELFNIFSKIPDLTLPALPPLSKRKVTQPRFPVIGKRMLYRLCAH